MQKSLGGIVGNKKQARNVCPQLGPTPAPCVQCSKNQNSIFSPIFRRHKAAWMLFSTLLEISKFSFRSVKNKNKIF